MSIYIEMIAIVVSLLFADYMYVSITHSNSSHPHTLFLPPTSEILSSSLKAFFPHLSLLAHFTTH